MSSALERLKNLTNKISSYETLRKENINILRELFTKLEIGKKVVCFEDLFDFKAVNISGVSLNDESLGEIKKGKYLQILAISYDKLAKQKSKNISLAYFGRVETVANDIKEKAVEFVIRYRFEKSFMTLEYYHNMLDSFGKESE